MALGRVIDGKLHFSGWSRQDSLERIGRDSAHEGGMMSDQGCCRAEVRCDGRASFACGYRLVS